MSHCTAVPFIRSPHLPSPTLCLTGFFDGCAHDCSPLNILPILARGWAFVSLEYRLAPQVKLDQIVADVVDGCEFVQSGALDGALGGGKVDGGRLCVGGASAGKQGEVEGVGNQVG